MINSILLVSSTKNYFPQKVGIAQLTSLRIPHVLLGSAVCPEVICSTLMQAFSARSSPTEVPLLVKQLLHVKGRLVHGGLGSVPRLVNPRYTTIVYHIDVVASSSMMQMTLKNKK